MDIKEEFESAYRDSNRVMVITPAKLARAIKAFPQLIEIQNSGGHPTLWYKGRQVAVSNPKLLIV